MFVGMKMPDSSWIVAYIGEVSCLSDVRCLMFDVRCSMFSSDETYNSLPYVCSMLYGFRTSDSSSRNIETKVSNFG